MFNYPYILADLKTMDRGETEVEIAARAGASAAIALGRAPIESLNAFIQKCEELGLDAMIDIKKNKYLFMKFKESKQIMTFLLLLLEVIHLKKLEELHLMMLIL